jgi:hypothetical protein
VIRRPLAVGNTLPLLKGEAESAEPTG